MSGDEGVVDAKAGDVLIQQATDHAWINHGTALPHRICSDGFQAAVIRSADLIALGYRMRSWGVFAMA
jgi:hypothetical protein